jgi:adenylate kinase family enzyme
LPASQFRERVDAAVSGNAWVADGNYSVVRDIVWSQADTVIWLDYPLWMLLWRVFWRGLRRSLAREELWESGNRESMFRHLFTRDSLLLWVLKTYRQRRREYPALLTQPEYSHLRLVRLGSHKEMERWWADGCPLEGGHFADAVQHRT